MAALGNILRKGSQSVHKTAAYEILTQDPSDNEEEDDDVLFNQGGITSKQNGFSKPVNQRLRGQHEAIELNNVHPDTSQNGTTSATSAPPAGDVTVKLLRRGVLSRTRIFCFVLSIIFCLGLTFFFTLVLPYANHKGNRTKHSQKTSTWTRTMQNYMTQSCVRLVDVDGDGRQDIINGYVSQVTDVSSRDDMKKYCKSKGLSYPCVGMVRAVRGYDGKEIWRVPTFAEVFTLNCDAVDINRDGMNDCIATGRKGTIVAINPKNGSVLWIGDPTVLRTQWNVYNALALVDFDGDGVRDLLISHGGVDSTFLPQMHDRNPGRLILLSGATGRSMGRYLEMPQNKETYVAPIKHVMNDGSEFIIFGSGGQMVPGGLYIISVPDLYRYVKNLNKTAPVPGVTGAYKRFNLTCNAIGICEIFRSPDRGILVPPVCADTNGDGIGDIFMVAYDGTVSLFDGKTLRKIWSVKFADCITLSSPAPGHFNEDKVLDIMLHFNYGEWPAYTNSKVVVLDGRTGQTLWELVSHQPAMSSALVIKTEENNRDVFVFNVQGRLKKARKTKLRKRAVQRQYPRQHQPWDQYLGKYPSNPYPENQQYPGTRLDQYGYQENLDPYASSTYRHHNPQYPFPESNYPPDSEKKHTPLYTDYEADYLGPNPATAYDYHAAEFDYNGPIPIPESEQSPDQYRPTGQQDFNSNKELSITDCMEGEDIAEGLVTEILMVDRSTMHAPLEIFSLGPVAYVYNMSELNDGVTRRTLPRKGVMDVPDKLCTTWRKRIVQVTGSIGDLDGDGNLDLVAVFVLEPTIHLGSLMRFVQPEVLLTKINLADVMARQHHVAVNVTVSVEMQKVKPVRNMTELAFRPRSGQPWLAHLGTIGDSVYHLNKH